MTHLADHAMPQNGRCQGWVCATRRPRETLAKIEQLKAVYGLELTAADAHRLSEEG